MTLQKPNPLGYSFGQKLPSVHQNFLQDELVKAIDGDGGGVYSPSSEIELGGSGLHMTSLLECEGNVVIDTVGHSNSLVVGCPSTLAVVTIDDTFTINGGSEFNGQVKFDSDVTVSLTGSLAVYGATLIDANVTFDTGNVVTFNEGYAVAAGKVADWGSGAVQVSSTGVLVATGSVLTCDGTASFSDTITINSSADVSLASIVTPTGSGRVLRKSVTTVDGNATYAATDGQRFFIPAISANRTYVLTATGAVEDDEVEFSGFALSGGFHVSIVDDVASPIVQLEHTVGAPVWQRFVFRSGVWRTFLQTIAT